MRIQFNTGRYFERPILELVRNIHRAGVLSRVPTATERSIRFLQYSVANDFREGFRNRPHGMDARSVAERRLATLAPAAETERREQEAAMLSEYRDALDEALRAVEGRLLELDRARGSVLFIERQRELRSARERAEGKLLAAAERGGGP